MSVVAAPPTVNGNHEAGSDAKPGQSPSRFTAVNGRVPSGPVLNGSPESHTAPTQNHERSNHAEQPREGMQQVTPEPHDGPEKPDVAARDLGDNRVNSGYRSPGESPNKRKRSISQERPRSPSTSYHSHSVSRSPVSRSSENAAPLSQVIDMNGLTRSSTAPEPSAQQKYASSDRGEIARSESNGSAWENYRSQVSTHGHRLPQNLDSSDAHLAETLQRDVHGSGHGSKPWEPAHRAQSDPAASHPSHGGQYGQDQSHSSQSQGPPKRKRIFSNRTKTGCLTCRRRKKKCDEQHPICNNCTRGGFPCEGYASRSTWQRSVNSKPPIPLQSKDRYPEVTNHYSHETAAQRHDFRPPSTVGPDSSEASRLSVEEVDRSRAQRIPSPGGGPRKSWLGSSWSTTGPSFPDHSAPKHDLREAPPMSEPPRPEQSKADYQLAPRVRDLSHSQPGKQGMTVFQPTLEPRPPHSTHIDPTNYPAQAQLALSMERHLTPKHNGRSEKDKMFSNELYRPSDAELVQDRERCKAALWRFINAGNPLYAISADERTRLLREVFVPAGQRKGSLGPGTIIEAPFNCHYGYNINIGTDVFISQNCLIVDDCGVSIGANTWIGPNVTILSAQAAPEMQERKGTQICYRGSPVMIYMDCYIGAGVTILPGTIIGRGVSIAPGQIVSGRITDYDTIGTIPQF